MKSLKKFITNSVLAGILAVATSASAEVLTLEDFASVLGEKESYCTYLGIQSHQIATERDRGVSRSDARALYAGVVDVNFILSDLFWVIDMSYQYPRLTPDQEEELIYNACVDVLSDGSVEPNRETFNF